MGRQRSPEAWKLRGLRLAAALSGLPLDQAPRTHPTRFSSPARLVQMLLAELQDYVGSIDVH